MATAFTEHLEARITAGDLELPVFPDAARQVSDACASDESDARQLAAIIRRDPALAAHFLRIANSPLFGARASIVSLPQALARLGTSQTRQIAMLVACQTRAFACDARADAARALRRRAVATAFWAQEIARIRRLSVEESFLCGLLVDVGLPALWQLAADLQKTSGAPAEDTDLDAQIERAHARVGAEIVQRWGMPARVVETIRLHDAERVSDSTLQASIAIVRLAETLAQATLDGAAIEVTPLQTHPSAAQLSLYADELGELVARADLVSEAVRGLS